MQTLKTAVVVVLLLAVLYGFYIVLSKPEAQHAASELARELAPPRVEGNFGPSPIPMEYSQFSSSDSPAAADPSWNASASESPAPSVPSAAEAGHSDQPATSPHEPAGPQDFAIQNSPPAAPDLPVDVAPPNGPPPLGGPVEAAASPENPPAPTPDATAGPAAPSNNLAGSSAADQVGHTAANLGELAFAKARRTAQSHIAEGRYRDALYTLSIFYNSEDLTEEENRQLVDMLDPLAGKVVYSQEHLIEPAYRVRRDETLIDIARQYNVPWQLLQNINGVRDAMVLVPGTELKVVPGPFRAEVDLQRQELTVFVGRYYAGRFPITLGNDPMPQPGTFQVRDKRTDRAYFGAASGTIASGDPRNPYGDVWLDLGKELSIHGSPEAYDTRATGQGCISLSPGDARDVFAILSIGSRVTIRR